VRRRHAGTHQIHCSGSHPVSRRTRRLLGAIKGPLTHLWETNEEVALFL
jgi:hypothetical protein